MDVVPAGVESFVDSLSHAGGGKFQTSNGHSAVVVEVRHLPAEVVVDVLLASGVCDVVLSADDMRHAEQVVIDRNGEVH